MLCSGLHTRGFGVSPNGRGRGRPGPLSSRFRVISGQRSRGRGGGTAARFGRRVACLRVRGHDQRPLASAVGARSFRDQIRSSLGPGAVRRAAAADPTVTRMAGITANRGCSCQCPLARLSRRSRHSSRQAAANHWPARLLRRNLPWAAKQPWAKPPPIRVRVRSYKPIRVRSLGHSSTKSSSR